MRLQQLRQLLLQNIAKLNIPNEYNNGWYRLRNLNDFRDAIDQLDKLNLFYKQTSAIKESEIYRRFDDSLSVHHEDWSKVRSTIATLYSVIEKFIEALNVHLKEDENIIAIKLPQVNDFDDLITVSNELKKAITLPITNEEIGGTVKIEGVDNGSIWLYVFLGTPMAVTLIASLAWAATVVYKKLQEGLAFNEHVKNLKLQNEQARVLVDAQREQVNMLITQQAQSIEGRHFKKQDAERIQMLKLSINTMAELIDKGFEIHPSLTAPESVTNLFPDFKSINLPNLDTKQIGSGNDQENKS